MAQSTSIEWTDLSWNPTHGCSKVSPGCANCYAETLSRRYNQTPKAWTPANAVENVILKPHKLREPLSDAADWRGLGDAAKAAGKTDGKLVFVNSMSDLFHEQIPDEYIADVFAVMALAHRHTFQVLTKRPERMRDVLNDGCWPLLLSAALQKRGGGPIPNLFEDDRVPVLPNVWLGTSIENRRFVHRADALRETPAAVRFISAEPLLGPLMHPTDLGTVRERADVAGWDGRFAGDAYTSCWEDGATSPALELEDIDWLIVGGESGSGHRPMREEWARDLRDAALETGCACSRCHGWGWQEREPCPEYAEDDCALCHGTGREPGTGTAFFLKQWGGARPGGEALLDGREWREFPQRLVVPA